VSDYCEGGGEASADAMESSTRGADDSEAREREITAKEEGRRRLMQWKFPREGLMIQRRVSERLLRRRRGGTPAAWLARDRHVII